MTIDLREHALDALCTTDPMVKVAHVAMLARAHDEGRSALDAERMLQPSGPVPGRPPKPELVAPRDVPTRGIGTVEGRAALLHALAHIEFNAINLALDAIWRFAALPAAYYSDWLRVASEEAYHFCLLKDRLADIGHDYGDFPAHDGLWEMAQKTAHDLLARMALVPRTLEARGLDVTPGIRAKFAQVGDDASVRVLDIILRDEIEHVRIGNRWFGWCCDGRGIAVETTYRQLLREYDVTTRASDFNVQARIDAGFAADEIEALRRA